MIDYMIVVISFYGGWYGWDPWDEINKGGTKLIRAGYIVLMAMAMDTYGETLG